MTAGSVKHNFASFDLEKPSANVYEHRDGIPKSNHIADGEADLNWDVNLLEKEI
jgi:hypothetical protein